MIAEKSSGVSPEDSRGGTRTRDPGIMRNGALPCPDLSAYRASRATTSYTPRNGINSGRLSAKLKEGSRSSTTEEREPRERPLGLRAGYYGSVYHAHGHFAAATNYARAELSGTVVAPT